MKYDKEKRGYILTPDEVRDLNEMMERAKRQYNSNSAWDRIIESQRRTIESQRRTIEMLMQQMDCVVPWWGPTKLPKS